MALSYLEIKRDLLKSDDYTYLSKIVDEYLEENDPKFLEWIGQKYPQNYLCPFKPETIELIYKLAYKEDYEHDKYQSMLANIGVNFTKQLKFIVNKTNTDKDVYISDLGFSVLQGDKKYSINIKKYVAKILLNEIFIVNKPIFANSIRKRFSSFKSLETIGINNYLLSYIYAQDESLYEFCSAHSDLLETISKRIGLKEILDDKIDVVDEKTRNIYDMLKDTCLQQAEIGKKMFEIIDMVLAPEINEIIEKYNVSFTSKEIMYYTHLKQILIPYHSAWNDVRDILFDMFWHTSPINEMDSKIIEIDLSDFNQRKCYNEVLKILGFNKRENVSQDKNNDIIEFKKKK